MWQWLEVVPTINVEANQVFKVGVLSGVVIDGMTVAPVERL